ncbi:unnamed protein product [Rotaria socialis]|uniref:Uncharacterized protein n=5 Tax=Rotaria socialis TaxID=392032 RepID=A0A818BUH3_9BILA|nr:unnamed protein product [Rotaria socialis]CAF3419405.1 unnamed protein product [Rotaria socialis]CAF3441188.1 unnamed protein product [Rotaria socialis]CAF4261204.1 unnamed protein product [Rotaria socialis]
MPSEKREPSGTRPQTAKTEPPKPVRSASTSARRSSRLHASTETETKEIIPGATVIKPGPAATPESKPAVPLVHPPTVTASTRNVLTTNPNVNPSTSSFTVSLYALRYFINSDKVKLQAVFASKFVQDFKKIARLSKEKKQDYIPSVFQLSANIQIDNDGISYLVTENARHRFTNYSLRVEKLNRLFANLQCDEIINRSMNSETSRTQFIFDLRFPRGTNTADLGANVAVWDQLCFFTYFIIHSEQLDLFPALINQFAILIHSDELDMTSDNFITFADTAYTYLSYIDHNLENPAYLRVIIQIWGILPLKTTNLSFAEPTVRLSAVTILKVALKNLSNLIVNMDPTEWPLIKDGLVLLMYIELLSSNRDFEFDSISAFVDDKIKTKPKQEIVHSLLEKLLESQKCIQRANWTELLKFISKNKSMCDYLKLSSSFDAFFLCTKYILQVSLNDDVAQTRMKQIFNEMISKQKLDLRLSEIVLILKFLQDPLPENENEKKSTEFIHSMVETSVALQDRIKSYLTKLIIKETDLTLLYDLFQYYNPILLFNIDKQTYLLKIFNQYEPRSFGFYTKWFRYFLCDKNYVETTQEWYYFEFLINKWLDKVVEDRGLFRQIMIEIDNLIDQLSRVENNKANNRRLTYFVKNIIDRNFKRSSLSDAIINVGTNVSNKIFLEEFERKFKEEHFLPNINTIKAMQSFNNPLLILAELYKGKEAVDLVQHLIEICCDAIEIGHDELLEHTLDRPSKDTLTYFMLFEKCFIKISLRQNILNRLQNLWNLWEEKGLQARQIMHWQTFTSNQEFYFDEIWNIVGIYAKKTYKVNKLFDKQYQEMLKMIKLKENIANCLNAYCVESIDKEKYLAALDSLQRKIDEGRIQGITVEPELKRLEQLAARLSQVSKSHAWIHYYIKQIHNQETSTNAASKRSAEAAETVDIDLLFDKGEERPAASEKKRRSISKVRSSTPDDHRTTITTENVRSRREINTKTTCEETLANANSLFDQFVVELDRLCTKWKELPMEQLLNIFPGAGFIESDTTILKEFLQADVIPDLRLIFTFWTNRKHLHDLAFGFEDLLERFQISTKTGYKKTFNDLIKINEKSIAGDCYDNYRHYLETIENVYSTDILSLCAALHVSKELMQFLGDLTVNDADNLLEAVNDWDETLISTKSVIDFVKLKTFFINTDVSIEELRSHQTELVFEDVAKCFDVIFKDDEFKNVIELFETCSQSVAGIKHLYLELTNKEQSKRRCIMDILSHSSLLFVKNLSTERLFDVKIKSKNLTFDDLSELRDRARLIGYSNVHNKNEDHNREIEKLESFVELVGVIEDVIKNLSALYIAGFPTVTDIIDYQVVTCSAGDYQDLHCLYKNLEEKLKSWEQLLCQMYEIYPELTYFSYEQFQTVESFLYNAKIEENHPGYHLLKYIGFEPVLLQQFTLPEKPDGENERLENLGKILTTQRSRSDDHADFEQGYTGHTASILFFVYYMVPYD